LKVQGSGFWGWGFGFRVWWIAFWISSLGFRVPNSEYRDSGSGCRVSGFFFFFFFLFFFFTLVAGPGRSFSLKLSDTRVYEPQSFRFWVYPRWPMRYTPMSVPVRPSPACAEGRLV